MTTEFDRERLRSEHDLEYQRIVSRASLVGSGIKWAALTFIVWMLLPTVQVLAENGGATELIQSALGSDRVVEFLLTLWAGGATGYAAVERKLRQDTIQRYDPYKRQAELDIDPSRSSSNLTLRGNTNPGDLE